jgi:DNA-binding PadR family transcriptional regulator
MREMLLAFAKIHVLRYAARQEVDLDGVAAELSRQGQRVPEATLYELLRRMERHGWLHSAIDPEHNRGKRYYRLTASGAGVLRTLHEAVAQLHEQLTGDGGPAQPVR